MKRFTSHGSGLLVPVIRGVVDFSGARVPGYQQTAADYRAYLARLQSLRDSPPPAVAAALKAKADAGGGWVARGHYETLRDWEYTFSRIREGGTYKIRNQRIDAALCAWMDICERKNFVTVPRLGNGSRAAPLPLKEPKLQPSF